MMRGFRRLYGKLLKARGYFTTVRLRPDEDWDSYLDRHDAIVVYARTKRAVTIGRATIVKVDACHISCVDEWELLTEQFCRDDAEVSRDEFLRFLRSEAKRLGRSWVAVFWYRWDERRPLQFIDGGVRLATA